jgi:hypothetical protein
MTCREKGAVPEAAESANHGWSLTAEKVSVPPPALVTLTLAGVSWEPPTCPAKLKFKEFTVSTAAVAVGVAGVVGVVEALAELLPTKAELSPPPQADRKIKLKRIWQARNCLKNFSRREAQPFPNNAGAAIGSRPGENNPRRASSKYMGDIYMLIGNGLGAMQELAFE